MSTIAENSFKTSPLKTREFRDALGAFSTGITIVTALGPRGEKVGMTVNSFSSVSLEPALILWSIDRNASCYSEFIACNHYAVHILSAEQKTLSNLFSSRDNDQFSGLVCDKGIADLPLLPDYSACFQCAAEHQYDGGDHVILVGRVLAFCDRGAAPLLYYRGGYASL
jgi:flavin reductase (DIM6/NTAB) family NADH-FMN oxidoreductase RutF